MVTAESHQRNYPPGNVLDGDLATRWSARGERAWLELELDSSRTIDAVGIAFHNGDRRTARFELAVSQDRKDWTTVFAGVSAGPPADRAPASADRPWLEVFTFPATSARYVRFIGLGNSVNEWNSLLEVRVGHAHELRTLERPRGEQAVLQAHIKIPKPLLATGIKPVPKRKKAAKEQSAPEPQMYRYGGDLRIGDLDNDGTVDFVLAKSAGGTKNCYLGAFRWDGSVLWQWGDKQRKVRDADHPERFLDVQPPARPGPLLVVDIDGDGETEVVTIALDDGVEQTSIWDMKQVSFMILNGRTGTVERRAAPDALTSASALGDDGKRHPPNYMHMRLLAGDFRGTGGPHDVVIKIGNSVIACDAQLNVLWTYHNKFAVYGKHSSYIPTVGDIDRDGRDEVLGGNYMLDGDGKVLWEKMMAAHNDSVVIAEWDGDTTHGREAVLSGYGQVVRADGEVIVKLGEKVVPHGQEVRVDRLRTDRPGVQMVVRYNGHQPKVLIADRTGQILKRFRIAPTPINVGMETLAWYGPAEPALLISPPGLWDGYGRKRVELPGLPAPSGRARVAWFHCIAADLQGDGSESAVLFDPCTDELFVYGAKPLKAKVPTGYVHTAKQYNVRLMD